MPNTLTLTVETPSDLLATDSYGPGAVIQIQAGSAEAGPFADDGTVAIVAATRSYTYYDTDGTAATWYRTRFENATGTVASAWGDPFQAGDETAGLICSLADVEQRLGGTQTANDRETLLDLIRATTVWIEGYCGRWFVPRPLSGTKTYRFHTPNGYSLHIPRGIRSITTLGLATDGQPESGGTYTTAASTDYYLHPAEADRDWGWPATEVVLRRSGSHRFYTAEFGAEITGAFGFAAVPLDVQEVAIEAVIRKYIGKERAEDQTFVGPTGNVAFLRAVSPSSMSRLDWYRHWPVA